MHANPRVQKEGEWGGEIASRFSTSKWLARDHVFFSPLSLFLSSIRVTSIRKKLRSNYSGSLNEWRKREISHRRSRDFPPFKSLSLARLNRALVGYSSISRDRRELYYITESENREVFSILLLLLLLVVVVVARFGFTSVQFTHYPMS